MLSPHIPNVIGKFSVEHAAEALNFRPSKLAKSGAEIVLIRRFQSRKKCLQLPHEAFFFAVFRHFST
jgi:hypothetical protein